MKKKILYVTLLVCFSVGIGKQAQAQLNVLKVNPLSLLGLTLNAQYERALTKETSIQAGLFFSGISPTISGNTYNFNGIGFTPEYRYYFGNGRKNAPYGFFVAPYLRYSTFSLAVKDEMGEITASGDLNSVGGGLGFGYQLIMGKVFCLEVLMGPGLAKNNYIVDFGSFSTDDIPGLFRSFIPGLSPLLFRSSLTVGFAF